jgi:hypothetical protein
MINILIFNMFENSELSYNRVDIYNNKKIIKISKNYLNFIF